MSKAVKEGHPEAESDYQQPRLDSVQFIHSKTTIAKAKTKHARGNVSTENNNAPPSYFVGGEGGEGKGKGNVNVPKARGHAHQSAGPSSLGSTRWGAIQ